MFSKIINTENDPVKVKVVNGGGGSFGGSFETDDEGQLVLRVVDAAPYAYDPNTDSNKVSLVANKKVIYKSYDFTDTPAGGETVVKIVPPPRKVWKIQTLNLDIGSISDSEGTHELYLRLGVDAIRNNILKATANSTARFLRHSGQFSNTTDVVPAEPLMQQKTLEDIYISESVPLYVLYQNKSNQSATRTSHVLLSIIEEGEL